MLYALVLEQVVGNQNQQKWVECNKVKQVFFHIFAIFDNFSNVTYLQPISQWTSDPPLTT